MHHKAECYVSPGRVGSQVDIVLICISVRVPGCVYFAGLLRRICQQGEIIHFCSDSNAEDEKDDAIVSLKSRLLETEDVDDLTADIDFAIVTATQELAERIVVSATESANLVRNGVWRETLFEIKLHPTDDYGNSKKEMGLWQVDSAFDRLPDTSVLYT